MTDTANNMARLISKNFIRTNQFNATIHPPSSVSKENWIDLSIKSVPIPGFGISVAEDELGGKVKQTVASGYVVNNVDLTFYVTQGMEIHDMLESWKSEIVDTPSNRLGYYDEYVGELEVNVLTRNERILKTINYHRIFPIVVGDIDLSYDSDNTLGMLSASFAYHTHSLS